MHNAWIVKWSVFFNLGNEPCIVLEMIKHIGENMCIYFSANAKLNALYTCYDLILVTSL